MYKKKRNNICAKNNHNHLFMTRTEHDVITTCIFYDRYVSRFCECQTRDVGETDFVYKYFSGSVPPKEKRQRKKSEI